MIKSKKLDPKAEMTKSHLIRDICSGSSIHLQFQVISSKLILSWFKWIQSDSNTSKISSKFGLMAIFHHEFYHIWYLPGLSTHWKPNIFLFTSNSSKSTLSRRNYNNSVLLLFPGFLSLLFFSFFSHLPSSSCSVLKNFIAASLPPFSTTWIIIVNAGESDKLKLLFLKTCCTKV